MIKTLGRARMTTDPSFIRFPRDGLATVVHKDQDYGWDIREEKKKNKTQGLKEITDFWNVIRQAKMMG